MANPSITTHSQYNALTNPYLDRFTSVSGSDIIGVFGHVETINLQGISVSVNREIHPIYVMGRPDPVSFVRGKRGVAGSLVMVCSDRGALYDIVERYGVYGRREGDSHVPGRNNMIPAGPDGAPINILSEYERLGYRLSTPAYYDQLPPFDVTLTGRSDSLSATISRVGGLFIVSIGTGMSVDDNSIEQQMTFVALYYEDWRPAGRTALPIPAAATDEQYNPFSIDAQGENIFDPSQVIAGDLLGQQFGLTPPPGRPLP